jgi:hypothetical protein
MMAIAAVVRTTPRCLMAINKSDQPTLNKRASQHVWRDRQRFPRGDIGSFRFSIRPSRFFQD